MTCSARWGRPVRTPVSLSSLSRLLSPIASPLEPVFERLWLSPVSQRPILYVCLPQYDPILCLPQSHLEACLLESHLEACLPPGVISRTLSPDTYSTPYAYYSLFRIHCTSFIIFFILVMTRYMLSEFTSGIHIFPIF